MSTSPPQPSTNESIDECYAASLADCESKLSREHYISEALLKHLNRTNDLRVSGLAWTGTEYRVLPPRALASKILCERHNSALSGLDALAVRFFGAFDEESIVGASNELLYLFSGHDIERWILKILCGLLSSRNLMLDGIPREPVPRKWLEILFGDADFGDGAGLYLCKQPGYLMEGEPGLKMRAIAGHGQVTGIALWACSYEFILSTVGFPSRQFDGRKVVYRPMELHSTSEDFEKSVLFSWEGAADLGTVHIESSRK
jgi:hypothetical protein